MNSNYRVTTRGETFLHILRLNPHNDLVREGAITVLYILKLVLKMGGKIVDYRPV